MKHFCLVLGALFALSFAAHADNAATHQTVQTRPVQLGTSGGNIGLREQLIKACFIGGRDGLDEPWWRRGDWTPPWWGVRVSRFHPSASEQKPPPLFSRNFLNSLRTSYARKPTTLEVMPY